MRQTNMGVWGNIHREFMHLKLSVTFLKQRGASGGRGDLGCDSSVCVWPHAFISESIKENIDLLRLHPWGMLLSCSIMTYGGVAFVLLELRRWMFDGERSPLRLISGRMRLGAIMDLTSHSSPPPPSPWSHLWCAQTAAAALAASNNSVWGEESLVLCARQNAGVSFHFKIGPIAVERSSVLTAE